MSKYYSSIGHYKLICIKKGQWWKTQNKPEQINTNIQVQRTIMVQEGITQFLSDDSHANDSSGTSVISSLKKKIGDK